MVMNRLKILFGILIGMSLFQSCWEEDEIIPGEQEMVLRFEFPQGNNSWDEDLVAIQEQFGVCMIYKDLDSSDLSRSWTGTGYVSTSYRGENLTDEQAEFYTNFFKNHVFAYLRPEITQRVLPPYWYMMYDFHAAWDFGMMIIKTDLTYYNEGLDFWVTCLEGEYNSFTGLQTKRPETAAEYLQYRGWIFSMIFTEACENGTIVIPEEFHVGFDYQTEVTYLPEYEDDENFYIRSGFPGRMVNGFNFTSLQSIVRTNRTDNFVQYLNLGMRYTKEEYEALWPSSDYPFIYEKRQFVIDYMKNTYNIDLEAIQRGPQI